MQRSFPLAANSPLLRCRRPVSLAAGKLRANDPGCAPLPVALGALSRSVRHAVLVLGYFIPAERSKMVCHLHFFAALSWRNMLQNAFSKSL